MNSHHHFTKYIVYPEDGTAFSFRKSGQQWKRQPSYNMHRILKYMFLAVNELDEQTHIHNLYMENANYL